jgi:hypothetical protein
LFRRLAAETASGAGSDEDGSEIHAHRQAQSTDQVNPRTAQPVTPASEQAGSVRPIRSIKASGQRYNLSVAEDFLQLVANLLR